MFARRPRGAGAIGRNPSQTPSDRFKSRAFSGGSSWRASPIWDIRGGESPVARRDNAEHHKSGIPDLWKRRSAQVGCFRLAPTQKLQVAHTRLVETPIGTRRRVHSAVNAVLSGER
jgi:hypothetical protein